MSEKVSKNGKEGNQMKKLTALLLVGVMALSLVGCGDSSTPKTTDSTGDTKTETGGDAGEATPAKEESGEASGKQTINIAWCDDTLDATRSLMLEACKKRVEEINAERDDIEVVLNYYDAQASVDQQISNVETAALTKPDVFVFSCVDSEGSLPCLQTMKDTGASIIDIRDMGSDLVDVVFYGSDEETYKAAVQDWIRNYLDENPDVNLKCGLIYGKASQTLQLIRCDLMKELAEEMPERIEIVAEGYGDWDTQKAMGIMEDWIQAYPEINFVCAANDIMALGASNALVSAGIKDKVVLTGIDLDSGPELIKAGKQDLDVGASITDNDQIMDIAVKLATDTWDGGNTYTLDAVMRVDASNIDAYLAGDYAACSFAIEK